MKDVVRNLVTKMMLYQGPEMSSLEFLHKMQMLLLF